MHLKFQFMLKRKLIDSKMKDEATMALTSAAVQWLMSLSFEMSVIKFNSH